MQLFTPVTSFGHWALANIVGAVRSLPLTLIAFVTLWLQPSAIV